MICSGGIGGSEISIRPKPESSGIGVNESLSCAATVKAQPATAIAAIKCRIATSVRLHTRFPRRSFGDCESLLRYSYPYATLDGCTSPWDGFDTSDERLATARWADVHHRQAPAFRHKPSLNPQASIDLHILLIGKGIRGFHARFISLSGPYSDGAPAARLRIPLSPFP